MTFQQSSAPIVPGSSVLVTGGAGFIGSHLVERLVDMGAAVTVVDNLATGDIDNLTSIASEVVIKRVDVAGALEDRRFDVTQFSHIFHLAGTAYVPPTVENPAMDFEANLINTFRLLEELRRRKASARLVFMSSAAVYGNPVKLPISETDTTVPISPYGVSKLAAERYVNIYSQLYQLKSLAVRFFSVYGPRQRKQVIYDILKKLKEDPTELEVFGDGSQTRDFIFVKDAVDALIFVGTKAPATGEVYNAASGQSHTVQDVIVNLTGAMGISPTLRFTGYIRPGVPEHWSVDTTRLQSLGFKAKTTLSEGLNQTRLWYESEQECSRLVR